MFAKHIWIEAANTTSGNMFSQKGVEEKNGEC